MIEQRGAYEKALFMALQAEPAAIDNQFGAFINTGLDPIFHALLMLGRHDRAIMGFSISRNADVQGIDRRNHFLSQTIRRFIADRYNNRQRHTAFAGAAECRASQIGDNLIKIGIRHDNTVVFRPAHSLDTFAVFSAAPIDIMRDIR